MQEGNVNKKNQMYIATKHAKQEFGSFIQSARAVCVPLKYLYMKNRFARRLKKFSFRTVFVRLNIVRIYECCLHFFFLYFIGIYEYLRKLCI